MQHNSDDNLRLKIYMKIVIFSTKELIETLPVTVNIKLCIIIMWMFHATLYD